MANDWQDERNPMSEALKQVIVVTCAQRHVLMVGTRVRDALFE